MPAFICGYKSLIVSIVLEAKFSAFNERASHDFWPVKVEASPVGFGLLIGCKGALVKRLRV